jgi:tetratricopeptide (TPR) repeat protein
VRLNPNVPAKLEEIIHKALEKDRNLRYQHASELRADLQRLKRDTESSGVAVARAESPTGAQAPQQADSRPVATGSSTAAAEGGAVRAAGKGWKLLVPAGVVTLALAVAGVVLYSRRSPALTEKDFILVADFENATGDAVFDGTLRKALAIQLQQSPYLNIVPDERIGEALRLMGRPAEEKLTKAAAREVCQREGVKAMLSGSIASLGSQYVIALDAANCQSGETLASEQVEAASKEAVLGALGKSASAMREKLGESLSSIQKLDVPLERATTTSLEALKSFSLGGAVRNKSDLEAIPFYKRAIELDPDFALAYARLGAIYGNLREEKLSREHRTKAFELRERVSELEKFYIMSHYYNGVTREQDRFAETAELWKEMYPRATTPRNNLAVAYNARGEFEKALQNAQEGVQLDPNDVFLQTVLSLCHGSLGSLKEYREIAERAAERWPDSLLFRRQLHAAAFLEDDAAEAQRHLEWARGRPGAEIQFLYPAKSATEAYAGRLRQARESTRMGMEAATRRNLKDLAAEFPVRQALAEALAGNKREARDLLQRLTPDELSEDALPALALALAGDAAGAEAVAEKAHERWPLWPFLNEVGLPEARAAIALERGDPARALEALEPVRRWERAMIWAHYLRGLALLRMGKGAEAAAEFRATIDKKYPGAILDRRHFRTYDPVRAVARVGLARALVASGEKEKARAAYGEFLTLWKDADADIPILREARAEFAKLQ